MIDQHNIQTRHRRPKINATLYAGIGRRPLTRWEHVADQRVRQRIAEGFEYAQEYAHRDEEGEVGIDRLEQGSTRPKNRATPQNKRPSSDFVGQLPSKQAND